MEKPAHTNWKSQLDEFTVIKPIEVRWGDMDAAHIVNNTHYLRWFEDARIEYLKELTGSYLLSQDKYTIVVAKMECKYIYPVTFPDTIHLGTMVTELHKDRFRQICHMFSEKNARPVAIASAWLVGYNIEQKKAEDFPSNWISRFREFEKDLQILI